MSNTESIIVGQTKTSSWRKSDTTWTLGLFGTAIGAGVLFFPIRAGFGGLIPILLMLVLAFPIAFYCHRALARLCLSGSNVSGNITETVEEHFGKTGGVVITFLYFFAICPLLWIYGVTITNTFMTFWENQLQMPALNRGVVALFLLLLMAFVIWFGKDLADAKAQNIPVLSYLANHFASMSGSKSTFATVLEYGASIIALVAIFKSFFGHYLGTLEGLNGLIVKFGYKGDKKNVSVGKLNTISMVFIMGSTWIVAYANPNILDLIEAMGAPIIASLLCLLPMYAIRKAPALAKYKGRTENIFVTVVGLLTILNIVYKLF